jgi:hypothetical protein
MMMKTIKELQQELKDAEYAIHHDKELKPSAIKKLRKRVPFLRTCIKYIESGPSAIFMKQEIEKVENKINLRMVQFPLDDYQSQNLDKKTVSRLKKEHENKYEIPHLREQVRTLRFLLK